MKTSDLLLLGGLAAGGYLLFFTDEGTQLIESLGGSFRDVVEPATEDEEYTGFSGGRKSGPISSEIYNPIQDLYIPPDYYKFKYVIDPHRIPSESFWDWYKKGSALYYEDYYYPPHYYWNPDYYFYFGNMYKKWYPNIYDIRHDEPWKRRIPYVFGEVYY